MSRLYLFVVLILFVLLELSNSIPLKSKHRHQKSLRSQLKKDPEPDDGPWTSDRIERVCQVFRYDLTITPYMEFSGLEGQKQDYTFDGVMKMHFQITNQTKFLPLRSESLKISEVKLQHYGVEESLVLSAFETNYVTTEAKVFPLYGFEVGKNYTLYVKYSGVIFNGGSVYVDWPEGLYYDNYTDPSGKHKQIVATFFEPTNSRKVFPSLDDPHFKAVFSLKLIHPKGASVYANTEIVDRVEADQFRYKTTFKDTPLISSYLFAFALGDFANATAYTSSNKPVRSIGIAHLNAGLQNSASIGANCVNAMEKFTGVEYPLGKLDNVDMVTMGYAEAMENLGMIVYEKVLTKHPKIATVSPRIDAAIVICHEISHQWFGDLVTADYWGVEFLHESFANFFEFRATQDSLSKEDKDYLETQFVENRENALQTSFDGEHAVVSNQSYFDAVTYESGGAILRMLEASLGSTTFYKALNIYLTKNAYKNADQNTLIDAFEEALNNQPVCGKLRIRQVMNDFLLQLRYPVVSISTKNGKYEFSQHSPSINHTAVWNLPLVVWDTSSQTSNVIWLLNDSSICTNNNFTLDIKTTYVFNYKAYSFARVWYSIELAARFFSIDTSQLDGATQAGLFFDHSDKDNIIGIPGNPDPMSSRLIKRFMENSKGAIDPFIIDLYRSQYPDDPLTSFDVYKNFDWTATTLIGGGYNAALFAPAIKNNAGGIKTKGRQLFNQLMHDCATLTDLENCNKILPDARAAVYCSGIIDNDLSTMAFFEAYASRVVELSTTYMYFSDEQRTLEAAVECSRQ